jgi:hypothetical protein
MKPGHKNIHTVGKRLCSRVIFYGPPARGQSAARQTVQTVQFLWLFSNFITSPYSTGLIGKLGYLGFTCHAAKANHPCKHVI